MKKTLVDKITEPALELAPSPEEKAKSLINKFQQLNAIKISDNSRIEYPTAKQCAILVIEEILEDYEQFKYKVQTGKEYWQEVRASIINF